MSTAEVAGVLSRLLSGFVSDVNVYGVEVPHADGRAGMAALSLAAPLVPAANVGGEAPAGTAGEVEDFITGEALVAGLFGRLEGELPAYAQPVFLRLSARGLDYTATFKLRKDAGRAEGFDPLRLGGDPVFVRDARAHSYVRLTSERLDAIASGATRL